MRPLRVDPDRVDRVLRALRVEGVRPEPERVDPIVLCEPAGAIGWGLFEPPPRGARPQTLQYPSSIVPEQAGCAHTAIARGRMNELATKLDWHLASGEKTAHAAEVACARTFAARAAAHHSLPFFCALVRTHLPATARFAEREARESL